MVPTDDPLARWQPTPGDPFDLAKSGHLLRRAAFSASLRDRVAAVDDGLDATLERLLAPAPADELVALAGDVMGLGEIERVRAWRFLVMLRGESRLAARMSLFWHQHFATSNKKVNDPSLMARQQATFDRLGLGRFDDLLLAASKEPAMLRWLDAESSKKEHPNENFARELLELFALGRGNYTERDVQEAARAFTGWHLRGGVLRFVPAWHDRGEKEVLGRRGPWTGEDVVGIVAEHPASARLIARKLLAFFVHPEPTELEVEALAACYTAHGRHVGKTLGVLLRSRLFFSARAWRSRIQSPVDLVVGLVRTLGASAAPAALARAACALGQALLEPPSVEGWHEERAWVSSATWLLRQNFAGELLGDRRGFKLSPLPEVLLEGASTPAARAGLAIKLLLDGVLDAGSRAKIKELAAGPACAGPGGSVTLLHAVMSLPEAQLL